MSLELAGEMRRGSADFMVGRSVSGCNKPGYKAATHPVAVRTHEKPSQTGGVHIKTGMKALKISIPVRPGEKNLPLVGFVAICVALSVVEGFDLLATIFVAPYVATDWRLSGGAIGIVFSSGLLGMGIGNVLIAPGADRIGRRPVILLALCTIVAGLLWSSLSANVAQLAWSRLVTGLGIGTLSPCLAVIAAEYTTDRWRSATISIMGTGFAVGAMVGGSIAAWLLAHASWRSVFVFGMLLSVAMVPVAFWGLPESLEYLVGRQPAGALSKINRILARIRYQPLSCLPAVPVRDLKQNFLQRFASMFGPKYRKRTLLVWAAQFLFAFSFYVVMSWTPKLATQLGYSRHDAVLTGVMLNIGGMLGSLLMALLSTKIRLGRLLPVFLLCTTVSVWLCGTYGHVPGSLNAFSLLAGAALNGSMAGFYALGPTLYAPAIRATGMGWLQGVSRAGAVLGPLSVGLILDAGWPLQDAFRSQALPLACAMIAVTIMAAASGSSRRTGDEDSLPVR